MAILVDGSKMRTDAYYGQNGSAQPSSIRPGDVKIKRSDVAKSIIAADGSVSANPPNAQTRTVSAKPIKPAFGMTSPSTQAKVPNVTAHASRTDGVTRPSR